MSTATKSRQRVKPERKAHLYDGSPALLEMTIGEQSFSYWLTPIPADWGLAFEVRKMIGDGGDVYHVHYDPKRQQTSCDCKGGNYHGHCKHQEAIRALLTVGKLSVPTPRPKQPASDPQPEPIAATPQTQPTKPSYCRHCGCLDSEHVAGFCLA